MSTKCIESPKHRRTGFSRRAAFPAAAGRAAVRLHGDQEGTISILSVFAVLVLTMVLGMVMNVGRQVDGKIRMQNAADAATYSGGLVLARGMNSLAFSNHLLCDVFALTAFMREARDGNSASLSPDILAAWTEAGTVLSTSGFAKFDALGRAILDKVPLEQNLVDTYGAWSAAVSARVLPMLEEILAEELISKYQRSVVEAFPDIAQAATLEVALRNGESGYGRGRMLGALWRSTGVPVGGSYELSDSSLDVVDPVLGTEPDMAQYRRTAVRHREMLARRYLAHWNKQSLYMFDHEAKMSQFAALWRSFTCGYLTELLENEYPEVNLPFVLRRRDEQLSDNVYLDRHFSFVGVVYWGKVPELMSRILHNPIESDPQAYAEVRVFVPTARLVWGRVTGCSAERLPIGGVPGQYPDLGGPESPSPGEEITPEWRVVRQSVPTNWDLLNQHWTCQLVPVTLPALTTILSTPPPLAEFSSGNVVYPELYDLDPAEIGRISPH